MGVDHSVPPRYSTLQVYLTREVFLRMSDAYYLSHVFSTKPLPLTEGIASQRATKQRAETALEAPEKTNLA